MPSVERNTTLKYASAITNYVNANRSLSQSGTTVDIGRNNFRFF